MISFRAKSSPSKGSGKLPSVGVLCAADLFKGIESTQLRSIFDGMEPQTCLAGTILFMPEDSSERLYILEQGRVDLYLITASGKRLVTRQILPGSVFDMMGLLGQAIQGDFAEAVEDSTIYVFTREDFLALLQRRPDITLRVLEIVGKRLRILEERFIEVAYSPVIEKLAHFLLINADSTSGVVTGLTHEEIGDVIGTVRQTVTETLGILRNRGLIVTGIKMIRVIDRHGLEEIVQAQS